jgi:GNAT superfamily N-acetyltransferase
MQLRELDFERDLTRYVELADLLSPEEPYAEATLREWEENRAKGDIRHRVVAVDDDGWVAGYGKAGRTPWRQPGHFVAEWVVDPAARNRGVGALLYNCLDAFLRAQSAFQVQSPLREGVPEALRFAEKRGFTIDRHIFESALDIASFDDRPFAGTIEAVAATGIRFFTFADLAGTEADQRRLYDLDTVTGLDLPGIDAEGTRPFEQFRKDVLEAHWFRPDGQILAADGDRWVGRASLGETRPGVMCEMMTGVLREYRGRKIALALKLLGIEFCRRHGATQARTHNNSLNAPMLAINRKLGYRPEPGHYLMKKVFSTGCTNQFP